MPRTQHLKLSFFPHILAIDDIKTCHAWLRQAMRHLWLETQVTLICLGKGAGSCGEDDRMIQQSK